MTEEERIEYTKLRIESAQNTYEAAKVLAQNGFWNSAVNRLYYSVFYAVNALLVRNEVYVQTHSGMRNQFSKLFVKTGKLDKNMANSWCNYLTGDKKGITKTYMILRKRL